MSKGENVAFCGLYCGECGAFKKGKCCGCAKNEKAQWCKIRKCNIENSYSSCADCTKYSDVSECNMFDNFMSKVFALIFGSNRKASINRIKEVGVEKYAEEMEVAGRQSMPRK